MSLGYSPLLSFPPSPSSYPHNLAHFAPTAVLKQTDMVKLSKTMDAFEEQFGEVDNVTTLMSQAVAEATANSTPVDSVEALMKQVAEENGLEVAAQLEGAGAVPTGMVQEKAPAQVEADADKADELQARLAKLRTAA